MSGPAQAPDPGSMSASVSASVVPPPTEPPAGAAVPGLLLPAPWQARCLGLADAPALQHFFDDNPLYFETVSGAPPRPDDALQALQERPPEGWPYTAVWHIGFHRGDADATADMSGAAGAACTVGTAVPATEPTAPVAPLEAMAHLVSDLLAPGVWHLGLFIVATPLHGTGAAQRLHDALLSWAAGQGAAWMRLGVVVGNTRAERFWAARGYQPVARRPGIPAGQRVNEVTMMARSLAGQPLDDYFARIVRDRPPGWAPPA